MHRFRFLATTSLAVFLIASGVRAQQATETYTYDELGRLIKVEVSGGAQDGEQRDYAYDEADNRTQVDSSGASGGTPTPTPTPTCELGPVGFTTTQSGYAFPRVYAPTTAGCGFQIQLGFTLSVESGQVTAQELQTIQSTSVFSGFDDTLEANEHAKVVVIYPIENVVSTTQPVVLRVNWTGPTGVTFASPGYSLVTINPN